MDAPMALLQQSNYRLRELLCVFRKSVTGVFGIVTDDFGNATGHFGDVTDWPFIGFLSRG